MKIDVKGNRAMEVLQAYGIDYGYILYERIGRMVVVTMSDNLYDYERKGTVVDCMGKSNSFEIVPNTPQTFFNVRTIRLNGITKISSKCEP